MSQRERPRRRWFGGAWRRGGIPTRLGIVAAWFATSLVGFAFAARQFGWEDGPLSYVVALVPWFSMLAVAAAVIALVARDWPALFAAGLVVLIGGVWAAPMFTSAGRGDTTLTVATVNLRYGNADAEAVVELVRAHEVDILSLQEVTLDALVALGQAGLEDLLPYGAVYPSGGAAGTALYSRFPITSQAQLSDFSFGQVRATVAWPEMSLTVFAVHPAPPSWEGTGWWASDMARLLGQLSDVEGPVLAAGDFNSTRDHAAFRRIEAQGYVDAVQEAGAGVVLTFPEGLGAGPLVGIDHVIARDVPLKATGATAVSIPGTDHRALVVTYAAA